MNSALLAGCILVAVAMLLLNPRDGAETLILIGPLVVAWIAISRRFTREVQFVTNIFLLGLLLRLGFGLLLDTWDLRGYFAPDSLTYDGFGNVLVEYWRGNAGAFTTSEIDRAVSTEGSGWGMIYLVGGLYYVFGRNILLAQSFCAVFGAATAPMIYFCSFKIFSNTRVARFSAICVAISPAFIIWSGQLLKDGLIVFLLVLTMTTIIRLQERFNYGALALLFLSLAGIFSLRFYIFYMVTAAVAGSFIIGTNSSPLSLVRRTAAMVGLGIALTYFGVTRNASSEFETYGNLQRVQVSRQGLSREVGSGYGGDADVSTTEGAISVLPLGLAYLLLAPFPWQFTNIRQVMTLPEMLVWWAMIPFLIFGLVWTIKGKLRTALPVLIFALMLTLAYSIFQGNVGTAYRQRTQIQVFLFMFIAAGWTVRQEGRENKKLLAAARSRAIEARLRAARETVHI